MNGRVTMADVARRAGVHVTTVSMALRNHPSLPIATKQRIKDLADKMGYRPDPALSALVAYRNRARRRKELTPLAYLTHWDAKWSWKEAPAHARFFECATAKAAQLGYRLDHFWLGEENLSHERMSEILVARGITGVVVASYLPEHDLPLALDWHQFSGVRIDYYPHEPALHTVTNDHRNIMLLTVRNAIAAGYRRIGLVLPRWWDDFADRALSAGFLGAQQMLDPGDRIPILCYPDIPGTVDTSLATREFVVPAHPFAEWLRHYRPEVLVSRGQFVLPRLEELGLSIPRDIAFVEMYLEPDGRTAGVRHNCDRVGELAIETLASQLQHNALGVPAFPTTTLVAGTWFDGESLPLREPADARSVTSLVRRSRRQLR
jgi:hypothetical protein